jgi:branched-subunit amino acid aminotransferase/4-amino-4-deoxychorismate lyase
MSKYCYFNGKIVTEDKAKIPVTDIAVLRGYAIFDSLAGDGLKPVCLVEHLDRFYRSAKSAGIKVPVVREELVEVIESLLKKNKFAQTKLRILLTGGQTINGGLEYDDKTANICILADELSPLSNNIYENGASLITAEYERPLSEIKTTNYSFAVSKQKDRKKAKAIEILYILDGKVYECSTSNFFIVKDKELITAKDGVLKGITRKMLIKAAPKLGLKVVERDLSVAELKTADEAFLTGTYKGIVPIIKIDNIKIGKGLVGPIVKFLIKANREGKI